MNTALLAFLSVFFKWAVPTAQARESVVVQAFLPGKSKLKEHSVKALH